MPTSTPLRVGLLALLLGSAAAMASAEFKLGLVLTNPLKDTSFENDSKRFEAEILDATNTAFIVCRRFKLAERAALDGVIAEKGLQDFVGALNGDTAAAHMEKLTNIDMIGLVSYGREKNPVGKETVWISVRLVSVLTGDIINTVDSRRESFAAPSTPFIAGQNLAQNIRELFPPEGYIVQINGDEAVVDLGSDAGLKKNDTLEIIQEGETIFHPVTGKPLEPAEIILGTLKVLRVATQTSTCKLKDVAVEPGARVRLKPKDQRAGKALNLLRRFGPKVQ